MAGGKRKIAVLLAAVLFFVTVFAGGFFGTVLEAEAEQRHFTSGNHSTPQSAVVLDNEDDNYVITFYDSTLSSSWSPDAWYSFTATDDGYLEFDLYTWFNNSCTWYICDGDERVIGSYDTSDSNHRNFKLGIGKGKTIYIHANIPNRMYDVYNYSSLHYKFHAGDGYENEPNNTLSQTDYLGMGRSCHVFTTGDEDEEFFGVQLVKNHTYRLTIDRKGFESARPRVYLRGVGGSPSSQVQITQSFEYDAPRDEYACTFVPLETGMHFIYITEAARDGEYDISLSYVSPPEEPVQPGDEEPVQPGGDDDPGNTPGPETSDRQTMYRLYNPNSGEHFYTADTTERDGLISVGWKDEGEAWTAPVSSTTPVYRVYNPNSGEHHYTTNLEERDGLIGIGWKGEGIGWYSDDNEGTPLYRLYNPNATGEYEAGAHHYTKDVNEKNDLIAAGWRDEGIGWYGITG